MPRLAGSRRAPSPPPRAAETHIDYSAHVRPRCAIVTRTIRPEAAGRGNAIVASRTTQFSAVKRIPRSRAVRALAISSVNAVSAGAGAPRRDAWPRSHRATLDSAGSTTHRRSSRTVSLRRPAVGDGVVPAAPPDIPDTSSAMAGPMGVPRGGWTSTENTDPDAGSIPVLACDPSVRACRMPSTAMASDARLDTGYRRIRPGST